MLKKMPFLIELFFSGNFILLKALMSLEKLPTKWAGINIAEWIEYWGLAIPFVLAIVLVIDFVAAINLEEYFRKHIFSLIVFVPMIIVWGDLEFTFWLASSHLLASILSLYDDDEKESMHWKGQVGPWERLKLRPAQMVLFSFTTVIFFGTFLLMLPLSSANGKAIGFIDALFTSTSATCVTGLTTLSVANDLSLFGQIIVLILIQIGGLSIMTLYSSMVILLGKSMRMKDRIIMQDLLDVSGMDELFGMIGDIIKYTFFIEVWGGIILTMGFMLAPSSNGESLDLMQAVYYGFFHSISAFCNAGFSLFDNSLENFGTSPIIQGTITILITLGGLGFIVLKELKEVVTKGKSFVRVGLHAKVVIITSLVLTISGTIFIFFSEFLNSLDGYTLFEKIQLSLFQSVTLRTAGFNTMPLNSLNTYTLYGMTLFMFIGGSPGSTAGGVKTTTLAILIQSIKSTLIGKKSVSMLDRKVPPHLVVRTTALTIISIMIASFFILVMMKLEPNQSFLTIFFEVVSASGTVGLTLGVTPVLSIMGKISIAALMLIGRIGPLTLALAIGQKNNSSGKFDYPNGRIMIG